MKFVLLFVETEQFEHDALPQKNADRNAAFASAKNPTEGEVGEVQRASRHDLVRALAPRYGHVSKSEKGQILDQVCRAIGVMFFILSVRFAFGIPLESILGELSNQLDSPANY